MDTNHYPKLTRTEDDLARNIDRLIDGLHEHGYVVGGGPPEILQARGQAMMNKAAGEYAPTWEVRVNCMRRHRRFITHGNTPSVRLPSGDVRELEVSSYMPLGWILKQPVRDWIVGIDDDAGMDRIHVWVEIQPPQWG